MRMTTTASRVMWVVLGSAFAVQAAFAQCENKAGFARQVCEAESGRGGPGVSPASINGFKSEALSTRFSDTIHLDTLPQTVEPKAFEPLRRLDRTDDGSFLLKVGIFEAYLESYALDPGQTASVVGGMYPAPIKGRRAKVIGAVLKQVELHPEVPQSDIQALLWRIVQGADLEAMPPQVQQTAAIILPRETLLLIKESAVAKMVRNQIFNFPNGRSKMAAEVQRDTVETRREIKDDDQKYQVLGTVEDVQSLQVSSDGPVVRGAWAQMPGGFYVRYLPDGLTKTRLQVIVPDAAMVQADPKAPLVFDPTQYVAVGQASPNVRLGLTMRPVNKR
jgi:hypothetical protein